MMSKRKKDFLLEVLDMPYFNNVQIVPVQDLFQDQTSIKPLHFLNTENASVQPRAIDYVKTLRGHYASLDPRTLDSARNQRLELDIPPRVSQGTQPLDMTMAGSSGNRTGFYKDYGDITGGDALYYTDLFFGPPYGRVNFSSPAYVIPKILKDPMGSIKPYYERIPINQKNNNTFDYSFLRDSQFQREDISALQRSANLRKSSRPYFFFQDPEKYYPSYRYKGTDNTPWTHFT
jgi:hypothetical protein